MPCRCDHMEPTRREIELKTVKELLFIADQRGYIDIPRRELSKMSIRGDVDELTALLCHVIRNVDDLIFYHDRSKGGLALAMWWVEHEEADQRRQEEEAQAQADAEFRKQALAKLSPEEREALGLYDEYNDS